MAGNSQAIVDQWDEVRERLRERWDKLTDEDLEMDRENVDEVINRIQQRTGQARKDIQRFLDQVVAEGGSVLRRAKDRATELASTAADTARERAERTARLATDGYRSAESVVREHPAPSVAAIFGLGCLAGLAVAWLIYHDR